MKTIKYVLPVIFTVSAGLSAMEPVQVDPERVQALQDSFCFNNLGLSDGIAENIVEYASAQERIDRARTAREAGSEKAYILRQVGFPAAVAENVLEYANAQEKIDRLFHARIVRALDSLDNSLTEKEESRKREIARRNEEIKRTINKYVDFVYFVLPVSGLVLASCILRGSSLVEPSRNCIRLFPADRR